MDEDGVKAKADSSRELLSIVLGGEKRSGKWQLTRPCL